MMKLKNLFILLGLLSTPTFASQSVFTDPSAGSCTDLAPVNTGTGTCTISTVTAFNPSETVTFTATTAGASATFSVSGSVSGSIGTVTAGSTQAVIDSYGYTHFSVNLSNGGVNYQVGDNFTVVITAGSELKAANFNLLTLDQICLNGCAPTSALTIASGTVGAPSLAFTSDADGTGTGIYRVGANSLGFSANGVNVGQYTSAGAWTFTSLTSLTVSGTSTLTGGIVGITNAGSATAGNVGEQITAKVTTAANVAATTTYGNCTSISLTAGDWDVSSAMVFSLNGATATGGVSSAISVNSGNTTTDHEVGNNEVVTLPPTSTSSSSVSIPSYRINVSGTTTVYIKGSATFSAGTPQYRCRISARRVR